MLKKIKTGIIIVGKLANSKDRASVLKLAQKLNWPVFPDISSGLRLGHSHKNIIHHYHHILSTEKILKKYKIECIIHIGGRITSKKWYEYIDTVRPQHYIMILNHPLRNDPLHNVTARIQSPAATFCLALQNKVSQKKSNQLLLSLQKANKKIDLVLKSICQGSKNLNESMTARLLTQLIPFKSGLFIANSMPIREIDMFGAMDGQEVKLGSNRGASGIDGTIASAAGFARGLDKILTLFIGDLAFLHDLNSLAMLKQLHHPMIIIVLNNNGGGIFSFLPIAKVKKGFEKYLATPHDLTFNAAADLFDLNYIHPTSKEEFIKSYKIALKSRCSTIIEITTNRDNNVKIHQQYQKRIKNELDTI